MDIIAKETEDEVKRRHGLVLADLNAYIAHRYPALRDAEIKENSNKKSKSVLDVTGIRLIEKGTNKHWFICLMGNCYNSCEAIKITHQSTSNATSHLSDKHNIVATKTEAHNRNVTTLKTMIEGADKAFRTDPTRWFEVNLAAFACEHSLPFNAFESMTWKLIADKLPVGNRGLQTLNIRKHYVEHYVTIKEHFTKSLTEAKKEYNIPFLSVSIDLIQNDLQNKKMIGVRVSYVHEKQLKSHNLAVRGYNPTRTEIAESTASELLVEWLKLILKEYSINPDKDVLTSCTDSGSDVKKALEKVLPTMREWCVSHLIHLALADAFGSHIDPNKTKHKEMRDFISRCRKVIEKVNKSKTLKINLEKKLLKEFGKNMKLRNSPSHRWAATEDVFVRLLRCWGQIRNSFSEEGIAFPLLHDRKIMLELRSVIHPLRLIQTTAQATKHLAVFQVYLLLMDAYFSVLDSTKPLTLYDPGQATNLGDASATVTFTSNPLDRLQPTGQAEADELDPRTTKVRTMLREAMFERFYKRYHPTKAYKNRVPWLAQKKDYHYSYLIDLQSLLHPALSDCRLIQRMIYSFTDAQRDEKDRHYRLLKDFLWQTILDLATKAANAMQGGDDYGATASSPEIHTAKRPKLSDPTLALLETLVLRTAEPTTTTRTSPAATAKKEIEYYQNLPKDQWPEFQETITWWQSRKIRENMPCLSQVAGAILACNPSSGGLECDFGLLKDVLQARRASLGQGFVEIEMMLKLNKNLFSSYPEKITKLPNDTWREYIPKRPIPEEENSTSDDNMSQSTNGNDSYCSDRMREHGIVPHLIDIGSTTNSYITPLSTNEEFDLQQDNAEREANL